jgi:regulator of sigma E protease
VGSSHRANHLITILAFLFVLGVLVFVHELGHFLVARWYGVRVITFSLGFGPKIVKTVRGGVEYAIGVVPLGGYVKLAGETVEDTATGAPDEFLSKSKWIRFQVYLAGPVMNVLLAFFVLAGVLSQGADVPLYESQPPVVGSIEAGTAADRAGIHVGDHILSIEGRPVPTWDSLNAAVAPNANTAIPIVVERGGQQITLNATPDAYSKYDLGDLGVHPAFRPQVAGVSPGYPAIAAGLQRGDIIVGVGGDKGIDQPAVIDRIKAHPSIPIDFAVVRDGQPMTITITPNSAGLIGATIYPYEFKRVDLTVGQAFVMSAKENWDNAKVIGQSLRDLVTKKAAVKQLMGPIAIAEMSGSAAQIGWIAVFQFMALISLNLGLVNLLPVPVLDGGHIAILAVEGVSRRDLSMRVKERVLLAGAAVVVLLMATAIFNDVVRLFR